MDQVPREDWGLMLCDNCLHPEDEHDRRGCLHEEAGRRWPLCQCEEFEPQDDDAEEDVAL